MNKKIMLLALGAVSVMMLSLPAMSSAKIPLHITPQPVGEKTIDGIGPSFVSTTSGSTFTCSKFHGTATFTSTTGGTMNLTFGPHCVSSGFTCNSHNPVGGSGEIKTTANLRFELVTLAGKHPGIEVTAPAGSTSFAHYTCAGGLVNITTEFHDGMLGTITNPACGGTSSEPVIKFDQIKHGEQRHRFLEGTPNTEYNPKRNNGETEALNAEGKVTLGANHHLECT